MAERHIVAMGGGGFSMEPRNPRLDDFVLSLARRKQPPRVCFVGTASGDSDWYIRRFHEGFPPSRAAATHLTLFDRKVSDLKKFVLGQDVIYVGGGSSANMLAVWRLHGLDKVLRAAWNAGVVMAGISAGAICWFEDGVTDSFGMPFRALNDGLGFVRGACCPHYDGEKERRLVLMRLIKRGFPSTLALDDDAAAHFVGTRLAEVVSSRRKARAMRVELKRGIVVETAIPVRYLDAGK
ncbi:Type 1 glutamine amidotransferase-like domain-containing protein [Candidatus Binatus sp.]|uniref:Type 1 glutamine amidotransferase-like domain-containing protein n=1 Tax=Candidatus Binatus sp. TaxID=2811406 RepID=UPI003BB19F31